ncbi:MAG: GNAT family protein [Candidatus Brocadiia bacterium]|jgi:RimJ/RimL family protein N-acetyltransferase
MNDTGPSNHLASNEVLHGRKVYLRLPHLDELSFIRALWGDLETMALVGGPVEFPEPKAREWFTHMVAPGGPANCYCLIFTQDHTPIGEISFHRWDSKERSAVLNVKVVATQRGHGYAKDAILALLAFFFGRVGGRLMTDDVAVDNLLGQHLLRSLGFDRDDTATDVCRMVMTRQMHAIRYSAASGA